MYYLSNRYWNRFYTPENFYKRSEEIIRYKYNTDNVVATISTVELRTAVKAYGKRRDNDKRKSMKLWLNMCHHKPKYMVNDMSPINNDDITSETELKWVNHNYKISQNRINS